MSKKEITLKKNPDRFKTGKTNGHHLIINFIT